ENDAAIPRVLPLRNTPHLDGLSGNILSRDRRVKERTERVLAPYTNQKLIRVAVRGLGPVHKFAEIVEVGRFHFVLGRFRSLRRTRGEATKDINDCQGKS